MITIKCPVCDRPEVEGNICPNCETDLSTLRMLEELPTATVETVVQPAKNSAVPLWLFISVGVAFLFFGIGLGIAGNAFWIAQNSSPPPTPSLAVTSPSPVPSPPLENKTQNTNSHSCLGFNYTVKPGDSLSLIASKFYGNSELLSLIAAKNSVLKGRENSLKVGEQLCIPNLEEGINGNL